MNQKKKGYYLETYLVNGTRYGIEDYKQKGVDHFMPEICAKNGRFHLWCGGCGIGYEDTLNDARCSILDHIMRTLTCRRDVIVKELGAIAQVITILEITEHPLSTWKVTKNE